LQQITGLRRPPGRKQVQGEGDHDIVENWRLASPPIPAGVSGVIASERGHDTAGAGMAWASG